MQPPLASASIHPTERGRQEDSLTPYCWQMTEWSSGHSSEVLFRRDTP